MHIDQTRLYRLSVVIDEKNLTRAADRLGLTQPTLSASIAQFEQELGVQLLERGRHGAVPTVYGSALYERSKAIEAELKRAAQSLREIASAEAGHLSIGATSGVGVNIACQALSSLLRQRSGITVELSEDWSAEPLHARLRRRELDWVIDPSLGSASADGLEYEPLFETRRVFVVRTGHPVMKRRPPRYAALMEYPFVAPERSNAMRQQIHDIFGRMGVHVPKAGAIGNSLALAKQLILNSDYFAVMTEAVVEEDVQRGLLRKIDIPVPTEYWYRLYRHPHVNMTPTARIFRDEIEVVCRKLGLIPPAQKGRAVRAG